MITSFSIYKNQSSVGWALHFMRDNTETIEIEELPSELIEAAKTIIKYCCGYQTAAEVAASHALELMSKDLDDKMRLELKEMHPNFNPYDTYSPGDVVKYDGHLCRLKEPVVGMMRAAAFSAPVRSAEGTLVESRTPDKDPRWELIGEEIVVLDWAPQGEFDPGYKEGDRVRFSDGIVRISKINNNRYSPDVMPEVWQEVEEG